MKHQAKKTDAAFSREAVAVFHSARTMQDAIDDLLQSGFDRAEINLLADEEAVEEKLGHIYKRVNEAEDDPEAPRSAYIAPETYGTLEGAVLGSLIYVPALLGVATIVASGGSFLAAAGGALICGASGGIVGTVLATLIGETHAAKIRTQIRHGGLLLWVVTPTPEKETRAVEILMRHSGDDVHVHGMSTARHRD